MSWSIKHLFKSGQPCNDFDVMLTDENWNSEWQDIFAAQIVEVKVDLVNLEVGVYVRQLRAGIIQDIIFDLLTRETPFAELHIKPVKSKKNGAEYCFVGGKLVKHEMRMSYLHNDDLGHKLYFKFDHVNFKSPSGKMDQRYTPEKKGTPTPLKSPVPIKTHPHGDSDMPMSADQ